MDYKLILAFLVAGMLLFGCTGASNSSVTTPTNGQNTTVPSNSQSTQNTGGTQNNNNNPTLDLAGKGWTALVALGTPIECNLNYKDIYLVPGFEKATLYIKGKKFKEVLTTSQASGSSTMTIISRDDGFIYMNYAEPTQMEVMTMGKITCDGIKTPINVSDESYDTSTIDTSVFDDSSKVSLECKVGTFGDEMFQVTGKYCTMDEITAALVSANDPCAEITDPETKAQCQQALGG